MYNKMDKKGGGTKYGYEAIDGRYVHDITCQKKEFGILDPNHIEFYEKNPKSLVDLCNRNYCHHTTKKPGNWYYANSKEEYENAFNTLKKLAIDSGMNISDERIYEHLIAHTNLGDWAKEWRGFYKSDRNWESTLSPRIIEKPPDAYGRRQANYECKCCPNIELKSITNSGSIGQNPLEQPAGLPTGTQSVQPAGTQSVQPAGTQSVQPEVQPAGTQSVQPAVQPAVQPEVQPAGTQSVQPAVQPAVQPEVQPAGTQSVQPAVQPTRPQPLGVQPTTAYTYPTTTQPIVQPRTTYRYLPPRTVYAYPSTGLPLGMFGVPPHTHAAPTLSSLGVPPHTHVAPPCLRGGTKQSPDMSIESEIESYNSVESKHKWYDYS